MASACAQCLVTVRELTVRLGRLINQINQLNNMFQILKRDKECVCQPQSKTRNVLFLNYGPQTAPSLSYLWKIGVHVLEDATCTNFPWFWALLVAGWDRSHWFPVGDAESWPSGCHSLLLSACSCSPRKARRNKYQRDSCAGRGFVIPLHLGVTAHWYWGFPSSLLC